MVRNGKSTAYPQDLPRPVPEGSNTFGVTLAGRNLTITLVLHSGQVPLTTLHLEYSVQEMYIEGDNQQTVKLCSTLPAMPAWEGGAGEQPTRCPSGTAWPISAIVVVAVLAVAVLVAAAVGVCIGVKYGPRLKERFCTNTNDDTEAQNGNSNRDKMLPPSNHLGA